MGRSWFVRWLHVPDSPLSFMPLWIVVVSLFIHGISLFTAVVILCGSQKNSNPPPLSIPRSPPRGSGKTRRDGPVDSWIEPKNSKDSTFYGDKGPKKPTRTNRRKERDLHKVTFLRESRSSRPASNTDNDSSRIIYLRDGRKEWSLEVRPETETRTTDPTKTDPTTMTCSKEPTT